MTAEYKIVLSDMSTYNATNATEVDLSNDRQGVRWTRGNIFDRDPQGRIYSGAIAINLDNSTGIYDPNHPGTAGLLLNQKNYIIIRAKNPAGHWHAQMVGKIDRVQPRYPHARPATTTITAIGPAHNTDTVGTLSYPEITDIGDIVDDLETDWIGDTQDIAYAAGRFRAPPTNTTKMDYLRAVAEFTRGRLQERRSHFGMRLREPNWQITGARNTPVLQLGGPGGIGYRDLEGLSTLDTVVNYYATDVPNGQGETGGTEQDAEAVASEADYGHRTYTPNVDLTLVQQMTNSQTATYAGEIVREFKEPRPFVTITFQANISDTALTGAIAADIGDRVSVMGRDGINNYSGHYFIENMTHILSEGNKHDVSYTLQTTLRWSMMISGQAIVLNSGPPLGSGTLA